MENNKLIEKPNTRELTLKNGIRYPSDEELIMMILGSGTKKTPIDKLARIVNNTLNDSNQEDLIDNLLAIKGMGAGKALAVAAAIEFGRRRNRHKEALILHPKDVLPFVRHYSVNQREHFICVTLNGGHEIIQIRVVTIGTLNQTIIHPRELFSEALKENAAAMIVCHNHPSGNCKPSQNDINTTKILMDSSIILGIDLLDHIIFSQNDYFSFMENKLLFTQ